VNVSRETVGAVSTDVSRETSAKLDRFASLFLKWNRSINLISRADEPRLWDRHIADALQLLPLLPPRGSIADLGRAAGFRAWFWPSLRGGA